MRFLLPLLYLSLAFTSMMWVQAKPANLPERFRLIGHYQLKSKIKVERGESMPVVISPLVYRVYSDGIDVRVYGSPGEDDSYTSYEIYRADGITVPQKSGGLDLVAGVQALCRKGEMVRQLSLTRRGLTMVKMPPRSSRVIITRAIAVKTPVAAEGGDPK